MPGQQGDDEPAGLVQAEHSRVHQLSPQRRGQRPDHDAARHDAHQGGALTEGFPQGRTHAGEAPHRRRSARLRDGKCFRQPHGRSEHRRHPAGHDRAPLGEGEHRHGLAVGGAGRGLIDSGVADPAQDVRAAGRQASPPTVPAR